MPAELVNPVPVEDAEAWVHAFLTTLLTPTDDDDFARRLQRWTSAWDAERTWAHRDRGRIVATLATEARTLTVPGPAGTTRDVEADALTAVTVAATHRRQGLLTAMLTQSLLAAKGRGDAVAVLIAAEWPIYGRYGYAPASVSADYTYFPRRPNAALAPPPPGSVRQVEPGELLPIARAVFDAARRRQPGNVDRRDPWWDRRLAQNGYEPIGKRPNWILHEGPDGPDGLLGWNVTRDFEPDGRLGAVGVTDFIAATDAAYRDLWAYLGGIDVIEEIVLHNRPVDEPVRWLLGDGRAITQKSADDFLWLRLLDVPAALAARSYAGPGRLVLDVVDDDLGGYGAGRVRLEADGEHATCVRTDEAPDLRLTQRALASTYLGGHRLRQVAAGGGVEELSARALERADVMFAVPHAPWNQTGF